MTGFDFVPRCSRVGAPGWPGRAGKGRRRSLNAYRLDVHYFPSPIAVYVQVQGGWLRLYPSQCPLVISTQYAVQVQGAWACLLSGVLGARPAVPSAGPGWASAGPGVDPTKAPPTNFGQVVLRPQTTSRSGRTIPSALNHSS